jgi:hypothetical protein
VVNSVSGPAASVGAIRSRASVAARTIRWLGLRSASINTGTDRPDEAASALVALTFLRSR